MHKPKPVKKKMKCRIFFWDFGIQTDYPAKDYQREKNLSCGSYRTNSLQNESEGSRKAVRILRTYQRTEKILKHGDRDTNRVWNPWKSPQILGI